MSNQEQERLRKLREQQLQARDTLAKQRKFQKSSSRKEVRMRSKGYSLSDAWKEIPHVVKSPFYGLIAGVILVIVLPSIWDSPNAIVIAGVATVFFIIFGVVLGNALDTRDRLKNNMK